MGNATESTLPHGNTSGYDRKAMQDMRLFHLL